MLFKKEAIGEIRKEDRWESRGVTRHRWDPTVATRDGGGKASSKIHPKIEARQVLGATIALYNTL